MDDLRNKIIAAIIGAIFGGSIEGGFSYFAKDKLVIRNEELMTENSGLKSSLSEKTLLITGLNNDLHVNEARLNDLSLSFNQLTNAYNELDEKYKRCTASDGTITNIGSIDIGKYSRQLKTGDNLQFKLTSSAIIIKLIRISDRGPIIEILGCEDYLTENSISISDSNNQYLLQISNPFRIRFSVNSCEYGSQIEPVELEEIQLMVTDFDTIEQTVNIEYSRDFIIK